MGRVAAWNLKRDGIDLRITIIAVLLLVVSAALGAIWLIPPDVGADDLLFLAPTER